MTINAIKTRGMTTDEVGEIRQLIKAELKGFNIRNFKGNGMSITPGASKQYKMKRDEAAIILRILKDYGCFTKYQEQELANAEKYEAKLAHSQTFSMVYMLAA